MAPSRRSEAVDVVDLISDEESLPHSPRPRGAYSGSTKGGAKNLHIGQSDEEIVYESSNTKAQQKGPAPASKVPPSVKSTAAGRVSETSEGAVSRGKPENGVVGNDPKLKSFQLPRGLNSSDSNPRQGSSNRKAVNGSPMKTLNQSLLKRARDSQSGSPDQSHGQKKRRLENSSISQQPKPSSRSRLNPISDPDNATSNTASNQPVINESPSQRVSRSTRNPDNDGVPLRKSQETSRKGGDAVTPSSRDHDYKSQRNISTTYRNEDVRESLANERVGQYGSDGGQRVQKSTDDSAALETPSEAENPLDHDSGPKAKNAKSRAHQAVRSGSLPRSPKTNGVKSTGLGSAQSPSMLNRKRVGQSLPDQGHDEKHRRATETPGIHSDAALIESLKIRRRTPSEDDQGYASFESNHLDDTPITSAINAGVEAVHVRSEQTGAQPAHAEADVITRTPISKQTPLFDDERVLAESPSKLGGLNSHKSPKSAFAMSNLSLGKRVEMVLGKYLEEFRGDNEHWTKLQMRRARCSVPYSGTASDYSKEKTSFAAMKPLPFTVLSKETPHSNTWGVELLNANGRPVGGKSLVSAPFAAFSTKETSDVPDYANYVSIKSNVLAPNVATLHYVPYFGDDMQEEHLNLDDQYDCDFQPRERKITERLRAQQYERYIANSLEDLDCSFEDLLRFLLELKPDVGRDKDALSALQHRQEFCSLQNLDFSRQADRWLFVLSSLPKSSSEKLARVAALCESFQKLTKFPIWHVARRSVLCKIPDEELRRDAQKDLTCRVCLRFDCPIHGEVRQTPEALEVAARESRVATTLPHARAVNTDIINPPKINYRTRIPFPPDVDPVPLAALRPNRNKHAHHWTAGNFTKADERGPFYPCHHPGLTCEDAHCSCFSSKIPCEKTCSCAHDCSRKFNGCACSTKIGRRLVCAEDPDCACYQSGRECDPDLCGGCGVCEVVDPVNQGDDSILHGRCRNASLQRGVDKHTLMGTSDIHGLGLYACETIQENEFVGEYIGEIILKEEADRRGAVYEHQRLSYLFSLNAAQEIDSTYFGNKLRFVNHAGGNKANLRARITLVNTTHRIGLYAERLIKAGEELLFDYGPMFPNEQLSGKKPTKSAPHVRNTNLVGQFYEVSTHTDELGNLRARKVTKATGKKKATRKPYGTGSAATNGKSSTPTRKKQRVKAAGKSVNESEAYTERGAGERLAAFNIAEEAADDAMEVEGEDESDDFVPSDNWGREESEVSDAGFEVDEESSGPGRRRRRRR